MCFVYYAVDTQQENEMEFIKLTLHDGGVVYINPAMLQGFFDSDNGAVLSVHGADWSVIEPAEYIAQHVYVCNKSYVNTPKGE